MEKFYVLILLIIILYTYSVNSHTEWIHSIRLIHMVSRHGDRTPVDTYPTDPYVNETFPPFGWGQLTKAGRKRQYKLGKFLRTRYGRFLGKTYHPDDILVQCTDSDRTKMSAQLLMAGLFPPTGNQIWNEKLLWHPVTLHYEPLYQDKLLLVRIACPRYYELQNQILASNMKHSSWTQLYNYLSHETGMQIKSPDDVQSLYSTLKAEEEYGLELPRWTKNIYPDMIYEIAASSFIINAYNQEMQKLKSGNLLRKIIEDTVNKANGYELKKLFLYVGHDSTVVNLMMALGIWEFQVPEYNTMFFLELHEIAGEFAVKVLFKNTTDHTLYHFKMPHCDMYCPLKKFVDLTKKVTLKDYKEDCFSENWTFKIQEKGSP